MIGHASTSAGHSLTRAELFNFRPDRHDLSSRTVAKGQPAVELLLDAAEGGPQAIPLEFVEDFFYEIGSRASLAKKALAGKLGDHPLGSGGNERGFGADQEAVPTYLRWRNIGEL
jgi:hypothetical protein